MSYCIIKGVLRHWLKNLLQLLEMDDYVKNVLRKFVLQMSSEWCKNRIGDIDAKNI